MYRFKSFKICVIAISMLCSSHSYAFSIDLYDSASKFRGTQNMNFDKKLKVSKNTITGPISNLQFNLNPEEMGKVVFKITGDNKMVLKEYQPNDSLDTQIIKFQLPPQVPLTNSNNLYISAAFIGENNIGTDSYSSYVNASGNLCKYIGRNDEWKCSQYIEGY